MRIRSLAASVLLLAGAQSQAAPPDTPEQPANPGAWYDPANLPFIPVPVVGFDPYSGTTLGLMPVVLVTDERHAVRRIIAPDLIDNPYFGYGAHARIFDYPSDETQWSVVGGMKQRVESEFDGEFETGRSRQEPWSFSASLVYDRNGTPRFFGIGNRTRFVDQTNYTDQQKYAAQTLGWNLSPTWQLRYTARVRDVEIRNGTLAGIPSIERRFPDLVGLGASREFLNRFALSYDTRDQLTIPTRGTHWVVYAGVAGGNNLFDANLYSVAGIDARHFWALPDDATLAVHGALRYMPKADDVPFWALSGLGGDRSVVADEQPLRSFGPGRFLDRNSSAATVEYRKRAYSLDALGTHIDVEVTPFIDVGRVYSSAGTDPVSQLHRTLGLGLRGIAAPSVVGYVDVGRGPEGDAVFSGIDYPF